MASTDNEAMEKHIELIRYLAGSLLGEDVGFDVAGKLTDDQIRIELHVPESHRGRVIGRGGRLARALRTVSASTAIATDKSVVVDIVD